MAASKPTPRPQKIPPRFAASGLPRSIRITLRLQVRRKAPALYTVPSSGDDERPAARANGLSLHAGVVAAADRRDKLERLCRYITRPVVSTERLSLTTHGHIHYRWKTPYRDSTTHIVFEPLDFIAWLAALGPNPRVNLTRHHGVFVPNHHLREQVTAARRGRRHDRAVGVADHAARHSGDAHEKNGTMHVEERLAVEDRQSSSEGHCAAVR